MSFVVKAAKKVVKAVGNVISGVAKAVGKVVGAVVDFVISPFMGLFGVPDMPSDSAEAQRQQGVLIQTQGSNVNIPVVYGYRKIGSTVVFAETGAANNKYLWVAYVFCEGAIEGVRELFIDDVQISPSYISRLNTGNAVDIIDGRYANRVKLQLWGNGYKNQSSYTDYGLNSILADSPSWKSTHTFNGAVVLFARYEWKKIETQEDADNNPFSGNIPQVQMCVLGRRVASLINSGTADIAYEGVGYTERYSTNPAEILLDYLRNPRYGKGLTNDEIDWISFRKAALKCNQNVTYINGIQGPILTCNHVVDTGQTLMNNVKTMLSNMRAYMPYVQGKYKLKIEDAGNEDDILSGVATIVKTFNKDNIIGNITYTGIDRSAKYNQVVVRYVDPDQRWSVQEVVYPDTESERLLFQTQDGNRENKADITFPALTNYAVAKDMARLIFNKSRYQDSVSFKGDASCFNLEPGDNVYIDANILKFGTDPNAGAIPWRIVSIKLNNDYTFDIGCVRNPDFIYPHVRVGEIDIVLPPYTPKGAAIIYPGQAPQFPVGLVPPTNTIIEENEADRPGNGGGTTDPTDPTDGGGVGAPDGPINTDPINNPPPRPPVESELTDFVTINRVVYTTLNGQIYANLEFLQPGTPNYQSTHLWYKRNISSETVWTFQEVTDKPGEGNLISTRIGPLLNGFQYSVKTRVKYDTNQFSRFVNTSILNPASTGEEDPADFQETVGSGWTLNTDPLPLTRDTYLRSVVGQTLLTLGSPRTPRAMSVSLTQEIYNIPVNAYVRGVNIYYKPSVNKFWNRAQVSFDGTYVPGTAYTFDLPFGLGAAGTYQLYDFVFRLRYSDSTEAEVQYRAMGVRVETDAFGNNDFDPFYVVRPIANGRENVSAYQLITVENAPPGSVADPRDQKFAFTSIGNAVSGAERIFFRLQTPSTQDLTTWLGAKIYYKEVLATATTTEELTLAPVSNDVLGYFIEIPVNYDSMYEYVIVPLVDYAGTQTEANNAWYFAGVIHDRQADEDYPSTGNWYQEFVKEQSTTSVALAKIGTAAPAGPVRTTKFEKITIAEVSSSDPREIDITIDQTTASTGNGRIEGVKIFYKPSTFGYWFETTHTFSGYTEGSDYTFRFDGDLGARTAGTPGYRQANYDFIFRWVYDNGEEGIYQARAMEVQVQGRVSDYELVLASLLQEAVDSYGFETVENAPPGAVSDSRDLTISFDTQYSLANTATNSIKFYLNQPIDPLRAWAGVRMYIRQVVPGENPEFTIRDFSPVSKDVFGRLSFQEPVTFDRDYEYVIVPIVYYNRSKVEARQAWYGRGAIHGRLINGLVPNFFELLNFQLTDTDIALQRIKTEFEQIDPTVQVTNWRFRKVISGSLNNTNSYYQVQFYHQHIDGYLDCTIYRRQRNVYLLGLSGNAKYFGLGVWEKLVITDTNTDPNGVVTVNLRAPLAAINFNSNASATVAGTGTTGLYNALYYNYATSTWTPLIEKGPIVEDDFLIVVRTSSGISTKGLLLPASGTLNLGNGTWDYDIKNAKGIGETVDVADFNTQDVGWLRRLDEAILPPATNTLRTRMSSTALGYTPPSASPSVR